MRKFTGFKPEHVGAEVSDVYIRKGYIKKITGHSGDYGVEVEFSNGETCSYYIQMPEERGLYFGHNIKFEVTGEEVPKPVLTCPVCGRTHPLRAIDGGGGDYRFYFAETGDECILRDAEFNTENEAEEAMKNLIKVMEQ